VGAVPHPPCSIHSAHTLSVPCLCPQHPTATRLQESQHTQQAATKALAERDRTIAQLQSRMDTMQREYEKIFHVSGDAAAGGSSQHGSPSSPPSPPTRIAWTWCWPRWQMPGSTGRRKAQPSAWRTSSACRSSASTPWRYSTQGPPGEDRLSASISTAAPGFCLSLGYAAERQTPQHTTHVNGSMDLSFNHSPKR